MQRSRGCCSKTSTRGGRFTGAMRCGWRDRSWPSSVVRMAEAVLEADDRQLLPRVVDLLETALEPNAASNAARKRLR